MIIKIDTFGTILSLQSTVTILKLAVTIFRIGVTCIAIVFITPQISIAYYDYVLRTVHSTGIFLNYPNSAKFVRQFTWFCIFAYLLINSLLSF
jgi:hypothetical protein